MNGVHDMGGMHGMGPIDVEADEPVFHDEWERRAFSMVLLSILKGYVSWDEGRHAIERMGAAKYLGTTYYEHWLASLETLVVEKGVLTRDEIDARMQDLKKSRT